MTQFFYNIEGPQADGLACVLCGADFVKRKITSVVVGRTEDDSSVRACKAPCAAALAADADRMAREMWNAVGLDAAETDGDVFGVDGHFGSLLRDLKTLGGAEALLTTSHDMVTIRFLLSLAARHAESALIRARLVLARAQDVDGADGGD
ncbi:hypothetical protein ACWCQZ_39330 [Streptomyces sp. NPDC002285]